jgi:DNA gyrase subunit A
MLISDAGHLIRVRGADIKRLGRNTQGVRVARPAEGDRLVGLDRVAPEASGDSNGSEAPVETPPEGDTPSADQP